MAIRRRPSRRSPLGWRPPASQPLGVWAGLALPSEEGTSIEIQAFQEGCSTEAANLPASLQKIRLRYGNEALLSSATASRVDRIWTGSGTTILVQFSVPRESFALWSVDIAAGWPGLVGPAGQVIGGISDSSAPTPDQVGGWVSIKQDPLPFATAPPLIIPTFVTQQDSLTILVGCVSSDGLNDFVLNGVPQWTVDSVIPESAAIAGDLLTLTYPTPFSAPGGLALLCLTPYLPELTSVNGAVGGFFRFDFFVQ